MKINWEQRRYELAKAAMQGAMANHEYLKTVAAKGESIDKCWDTVMVNNCVYIADEMIKQLRKD